MDLGQDKADAQDVERHPAAPGLADRAHRHEHRPDEEVRHVAQPAGEGGDALEAEGERSDDQAVQAMELEHYPGMSERAIEAMVDDAFARFRLRGVRIGGQADVLVYSGDNPVMNLLGRLYIRVMSWLSYLY